MSSLKKLPPNVARELLRHVNPSPKSATASQQQTANGAGGSQHRGILLGCLAFTGAAASIPLLAHLWVGRLTDKEDALSAAQVRRGAFLNSGSKDVGVDPNWNFATGEYKQDTGYAAMAAEEAKLQGEFLAMSEADLKKHEEKLEAFAKGRARSDG